MWERKIPCVYVHALPTTSGKLPLSLLVEALLPCAKDQWGHSDDPTILWAEGARGEALS